MRELLERLCRNENLAREQVQQLFARIVQGELSEIELSALLIALKAKGETPEEIAGSGPGAARCRAVLQHPGGWRWRIPAGPVAMARRRSISRPP
jgi:anthranilate phosphoribosyltransferase